MLNLKNLAKAAKAHPKIEVPPVIEKEAEEKMTRRAALRRIGMTGGLTVLGVLSIDELARLSAKKLEQHEMTKGLAKDFKEAGVAFADTTTPEGYGNDGNGEGYELADCQTRANRWRRYCKDGCYLRCNRNTFSQCYKDCSNECDEGWRQRIARCV